MRGLGPDYSDPALCLRALLLLCRLRPQLVFRDSSGLDDVYFRFVLG
jgi:hypothetical protein